MKRAEIITVGNEILSGSVLDSNSNWLCKQITGLGGHVDRVVTVGDEIDAIAREIQSALSRSPDLILTLGGLGPTADDMTLAAVAKAAARNLELNKDALDLVQSRYEELHREGSVESPELNDARKKMARLPKGARPLENNVGAAPGSLLQLDKGPTVVSLPGVPDEMKHIFSHALQQTIQDLFGSGAFSERVLITDCGDESVLSPLLRKVSEQFQDVYVKSRPKTFGPEVRLRITFSARGDSPAQVSSRLDETEQALRTSLKEQGIEILEGKRAGVEGDTR